MADQRNIFFNQKHFKKLDDFFRILFFVTRMPFWEILLRRAIQCQIYDVC
jgi:hypothetical protein